MLNKSTAKKFGEQRFCNLCHIIKKLIQKDRLQFDILIAAGNSGLSVVRFTELIYQELGQNVPEKLLIPFFRYFPGHKDNPDKAFDIKIFFPEIVNQVRNLNKEIKNVLFVDDEIGLGITATSILTLINLALKEIGKPTINNYYIIAEDLGFKIPKNHPEIKFIPLEFGLRGYNDVIFYLNPPRFEKKIIDVLGNNDRFAFYYRTNILLDLPIKDFNSGMPIYTDNFLKIMREKIPNFQKIQKAYLAYIKQLIKNCLENKLKGH